MAKNKKNRNMESFFDVIERNMKNVPGFKALVTLLMYLLFFIFFIIVVRIGVKKNNHEVPTTTSEVVTTTEKVEAKNYKTLLSELSNVNKYKVTVNNVDKVSKLEITIEEGILTGFIETDTSTNKIKIQDNQVYEVKMDQEVLNETLLSGLNIFNINLKDVYNLLSNNKSIKTIGENNIKYIYSLEDKQITVLTNEEKVERIEIVEGNISYIIEI